MDFRNLSLAVESWISLGLSVVVFGILLGLFAQRARFLYTIRTIPYPTALPFIGNSFQLNCSLEDFFRKINDWSREFGDIYLFWVGMRPFIFLYKAEFVQPLLSSSVHIDKSIEYQYLKPWLGGGLITSSGDRWQARRKLLTPSFHSNLLGEYLQIAIREAKVFVSCLQAEVNQPEVNIVPYAKRAALDVICDSSMGYHINAQTCRRNEYYLAVERMSSISQARFTNVWLSYDWIFDRTKMGKEQHHALKIIHEFVDKVIADRKAEWSLKHDGNFNKPVQKRQALLDLLLDMSQNGTVLSDEDIRDEVNTFMFAGHDTTATTVSWTLYALGHHIEYQTKILQEYDEVIGNNEITVDALSKLVWLDACLKESWRLYPVAPLIARQIYKPINLNGHNIPPGSTVLVNAYVLHRDPRHYPQPEVYNPERFLPGSPKPATFAFIPFSAGSRNCIGWRFATIVVKVMLLAILKSYKVESVDTTDKLRLRSEIVLTNANGVRLRITPR